MREDFEKMGHQKRADVVRMPEWGMRVHGGAAHPDDRKALGQRPPALELVVPILALERRVVRPERGRGELGRAVVRHAVVLINGTRCAAHGLGRAIQISGLILDLVASMVAISTSRLGRQGLVLRPYRVLPRVLRHARTATGQ